MSIIQIPTVILKPRGFNNIKQIPAKWGPASRFIVEGNIKALMSKWNSRQSKKMMVQGQNIRPCNVINQIFIHVICVACIEVE